MFYLQIYFPKTVAICSRILKSLPGNLSWDEQLLGSWRSGLLFYQAHWDLNPCASMSSFWQYANTSLNLFLFLCIPLWIQKQLSKVVFVLLFFYELLYFNIVTKLIYGMKKTAQAM